MSEHATHIDRLLDAIELMKLDRRDEARVILRELIHENNDSEDVWLWMSVAVDSLDQSSICLDNVLRINPNNSYAAGALFRLRETDMLMQKRRSRLRMWRDLTLGSLWMMFLMLLFAVLLTYPPL